MGTMMHTKRLVHMGAVFASSVLTWWTAHRWLSAEGQFSDWQLYLPPLLFAIVFGALAGLALALLRSRWDRIAVITSSWASFVIFFPASIWYISALPLFFFFWMDASRRSHDERLERNKIRVRNFIGVGAKLVLLGIFLMISLGFYSVRTEGGITLDAISRGVQRQVDVAYETQFVQEQLSDVPPSLQGQFRRDFARQVDAFVRRWLAPVAQFIPPILALFLFLGLWSVVWLIREPVLWVASGVFAIMRRTGFVTVTQKQVPKEVITLE